MIEHIEKFLNTRQIQSGEESSLDPEQHFQQTLQDLQSPDLKQRRVAIYVLAELKDPRAVPGLLTILRTQDRLIQRDAIEALEAIGDPRAVPDLLAALRIRDWFIQQVAIEALGTIGDPMAIPDLVMALQDDDKWVATEAAEALGRIRHIEAVPALLETLRSQELLRSFQTSAQHEKQPVEDNAVAPIGTFFHEIRDLRCAVTSALGQIGDSRAIEHLIAVMHTDPDAQVQRVAAEALEEIGSEESYAAVRAWRSQQTSSQ
jgi:HEAT repeat protein